MPPKHDAGTATRHYRAFWQRRCRAAAAGAVLKPQGGNCAVLPLLAAAHPFSLAYSSSVTGSHHSLLQSSPGTSTAMWLNQLSALAPCQCLTLAGMVITVPGVRLTAGLPSSWYQPRLQCNRACYHPWLHSGYTSSNSTTIAQHKQASFKATAAAGSMIAGIINQQGSGCSRAVDAVHSSPPTICVQCPVCARSVKHVAAIFFQNSLSKKLPAQRLIIPCTGS